MIFHVFFTFLLTNYLLSRYKLKFKVQEYVFKHAELEDEISFCIQGRKFPHNLVFCGLSTVFRPNSLKNEFQRKTIIIFFCPVTHVKDV